MTDSRGEPVIIPEHLQLIDSSVFRALHADLAATPWEDQSLSDLKQIEELLIRRSRKPTGGQDEEKILAYAREHSGLFHLSNISQKPFTLPYRSQICS
jgi:hypothetical protein